MDRFGGYRGDHKYWVVRLWVWAADDYVMYLKSFFVSFVNNASNFHIYELRIANKIDAAVKHNLGYFSSFFPSFNNIQFS